MPHSVLVFLGLVGIAVALPTNIVSFVKPEVYDAYDNNADLRIVGGLTASRGQFPYIASLRWATTNSHFCGGTIVSNRYIISAARCIVGTSASSINIFVGTNTLNTGGTRYSINRLVSHPKYSSATAENDIGLLRTSTTIAFGTLVSSLPISSSTIGGGVTATLSGWGTLSDEGVTPNNLQYIQLKTITNTECSNVHYPNPTFSSQICTYTRYGEGACHGDTGGPLVVNGVLVGAVSWGQPCGIGYPDVFTRISSYVGWIQDNAT